jgi:cytochrome P450
MFAVIFEVQPKQACWDDYLDLARLLKPELEKIDGFIDNGRADGAVDYAQQIPPRVIASMLGIPQEEAGTFTEWVRNFLELGLTNTDLQSEAARNIFGYLWERIQEHKEQPKDDLISYLLSAEVDGEPVPEPHVLGTSFLILLAGIDTTSEAAMANRAIDAILAVRSGQAPAADCLVNPEAFATR